MEKNFSFLQTTPRGVFYDKKKYVVSPLNTFEDVKDELPEPFVVAKPQWSELYWYALKVLFTNTHQPKQDSGFVSNFVDAAFNNNIFLWDTCFMTLFCNLVHEYVPGIESLDNFYCKQFNDGEIPREMVRDTGKDFLYWVNAYDKPLYSMFHNHYGFRGLSNGLEIPYSELYKPDLGRMVENNPYLTLDNLNHPILAFAEWYSYIQTKDHNRLAQVFEPLYQYYCSLHYHLRHENALYVTDWASMDNSPRNTRLALGVDISCEMVLFAKNLQDIMDVLRSLELPVVDHEKRYFRLAQDKDQTIHAIQYLMYNEADGFFYDLDGEGNQIPIKTAAAFWTMISQVATPKQQEQLVWYLNDPDTFCRLHRVPVLAANEEGYDPRGGYWRGSVWAPINSMVVLGLEECGYAGLAREIGLNDLEAVSQVFKQTGTIWENYPADEISKGDSDHPDMVGWSGIAPILFFIRYGVGLRTTDIHNTLEWTISEEFIHQGPIGCKRFSFYGKKADFSAKITSGTLVFDIQTNDSFILAIRYKHMEITKNISEDICFTWSIGANV
ncbi:MAG: trehalase family glycosidase [Sphaerochaeta sp.]|nr:trehalase family glycosidase [Sphaerochaeta sp.]